MFRIFLIISMFCCNHIICQSITRSLAEVRSLAIANSPKLRASDAAIAKSKLATKSAVIFDSPVLKLESPTGTFYTLGIEQNFNLPTVYRNQRKLSEIQNRQVENERMLNQAEVIYNVSTLYLDLQHQQVLTKVLKEKKDVLDSISKSSKKIFDAGETDYLSVKNADIEHDQVTLEYFSILNENQASLEKLKFYLGNSEEFIANELTKYDDLLVAQSNSSTSIFEKQILDIQEAAQQELKLAKLESLPGFNIGYMNQAERNSDWKYRFGLGMTLPIWFKQNKATQATAKANIDYIAENSKALSQDRAIQITMLKNKMEGASKKIDFIKNTGLKNLEELISVSNRMLEAGQNNLIAHLLNLVRIYEMRQELLDNIKTYNNAVLELEYLNAN